MEDIRLPGPQTRIVMLGNNVFKVKYKLSVRAAGHSLCSDKNIQDDIKSVTEAILNLLSSTGNLITIKTNNIVVYPGSLPWKKAVYSHLLFSYNGQQLQPHPQIIFLLVHILTPVSPKTPAMQVKTGTPGICLTPRRLGKRIRPISCCPGDEQLPLMTGIPSSVVLARKRLKLEDENIETHIHVPQDVDAALPAESARGFPMASQHARENDVRHIAHCAEQTKKRLHDLSQPSAAVIAPERDNEDIVQHNSSVFQKIFGSVKSFFGW